MALRILIILLLFLCIMLVIGIIDGKRYVKTSNEFVLPNLKKDCKFVMFSDLHDNVFGKNNEKLINDIKAENPDFIVIAGDLITSHYNESYKTGIDFVNELSKDFKIYYGMGNHETRIKTDLNELPGKYEELLDGVKDKTVMLSNESVYIDEYNIELTGLEISRAYFKRFKKFVLPLEYVESLIGKRELDKASILIAHNPSFFDTYVSWGADLVLAGHVHGGIMKLPIIGGVIAPSFLLFPKYDSGVFKEGKTTMLLSRGLGAHSIPLRFFNPCEFHVVKCLKES